MHTHAITSATPSLLGQHFLFPVALLLLLLTASVRADQVPLQSFELDPMAADDWLPDSPVTDAEWPVTLFSSWATVTRADAADGAQSIVIARGNPGNQTRVALDGHLPLADMVPVFVDFWLRPTSWSGTGVSSTGSPTLLEQGTQIFVDGHFFSFFQYGLNSPLRPHYHDHSSGWKLPELAEPALSLLLPILDRPASNSDVSAREWVRFTARIDPVTNKADVWVNGKLAIVDAPRSSSYAAAPVAPSFYLQGSSNGPVGFDAFQCATANPLFGDMDRDGLPDSWELAHGLNISLNDRESDLDGDGLTNLRELILRTLPESNDSDHDFMPDEWEVAQGLDPLFARDSRQDLDYDGATNYEEYAAGTNPWDITVTPREATYVMAVDPMYPPNYEDGSVWSPYSTLQAAIGMTAEGGTVVVLPSSYPLIGSGNAGASIYRSLTIKGNGAVVDGRGEFVDQYDEPYTAPAFPGLLIFGGDVVIEDLQFGNCNAFEGGAVFADGLYNPWNPGHPTTSVTLRRCSINSCQATDDGGAVRFFYVPSVIIEDCTLWYCRAADKGGAFSAEGSDVTIRRCRFQSNSAGGDAGGLHFKTCTGLMENCLIATNTSDSGDGGGAAFKSDTSVAVSFCTVVGNVCYRYGAGFYNSSAGSVALTASILWGNDLIPINGTIDPNTQIVGPCDANYTTAQSQSFSGGTANSGSDPQFLPGGYTLKYTSPAIDAAVPPPAYPATDLDGNTRQHRGGITAPSSPADRGCYEYSDTDGDGLPDAWEIAHLGPLAATDATNRDADLDGDGYTNYEEWLANSYPQNGWYRPPGAVIYVDPRSGYGSDSASGGFSTPVKTISKAISLVMPNAATTRICLRDGIYSGAANRDLTTGSGAGSKRFYIKGINGKSRVTIDCGGANRFLKIENYSFDSACGIEGVTIRNGYVADNGGAILVTATSLYAQPFIAHCTIAGCHASGEGGAICAQSGSLLVYECELFANYAQKGGAVSIGYSTAYYYAVYGIRCTLAYNSADIGGGIYSRGYTWWKDGAIFRNLARQGGGVVIDSPSTMGTYSTFSTLPNASFKTTTGFPTTPSFFNGRFNPYVKPPLNGCRFTENNAWSDTVPYSVRGGAIAFTEAGEPTIESLILERNRSSGAGAADGGGVWIANTSPLLRGCIFRGNETTGNGGGIGTASSFSNGEPIILSNCAFCDNSAAVDGGAISALPITQSSSPQVYSRYQVEDCTITYNRSTSRVIDLPESSSIYLWRSIICYNRTDPGNGVAGISEPSGSSFLNNYLDFNSSGNTPPTIVTDPPTFAWDHIHLLKESSPRGPAFSTAAVDIDFESRIPYTPRYTGCDEWTDTNNDGIPDWYARLIADMSPDDTVTLSTGSVAGLLLWGAAGPTVMQVFQAGINPAANPATSDEDEDGLTNTEELTEFGTDPNSNNSAGGNLTDAQLVGRGNTVDTDDDGVFDDLEALPLRKDYRWPKAPAPTAYVAVPLGANTYAMGVTRGGKILLQDRSGEQPYGKYRHFIVSQEEPTPATASRNWLPSSRSSYEGQTRIPGNFYHNAFGGPKIADDMDAAAVLDEYYYQDDSLVGISYGANEFYPLGTNIARPTYLPGPVYSSSIWDHQYVEWSYLWLNNFGEIYGYLKWENGGAYDEYDIDEDYYLEEGESSARILMRWPNAGSAPQELTSYANPPQHGNPLPTHKVLGDSMNQTQDDPPGLALIWAVSPGGAVLYYETETQPVEFYGNQYLVTAGNDRFLLEKPLTMSLATHAYDVFDFPSSSNPAQGEIIGPVAVGNYQGNALSPAATVLWERTRPPNGGTLTPPKRKTLPVYPATGAASELGQIIIRDISPKGEILFTDDFTDIEPYPNYNSLWRNGEIVELDKIAGRPNGIPIDDPETIPREDGNYRAIGFGKDGAIVANLFGAGNDQAVILLPVEVVELAPPLRHGDGTVIAGSQMPRPLPAANVTVEVDPGANPAITNASLVRTAWREIKVKFGIRFAGLQVNWSLTEAFVTPVVANGQLQSGEGTNDPIFRGSWADAAAQADRNRFRASVTYGANGFALNGADEANTTVDAQGFTAVRVNLPPIGLNKVHVNAQLDGTAAPLRIMDLQVPALVVIDPGHGGSVNLPDNGGMGSSKYNNAVSCGRTVPVYGPGPHEKHNGESYAQYWQRVNPQRNGEEDEAWYTRTGRTSEKTLTLKLGRLLRHSIRRRALELKIPMRVVLTRDADINLHMQERSEQSKLGGADIFMSLHFNGDDRENVRGGETWLEPGTPRAQGVNANFNNDSRFAHRIQNAINANIPGTPQPGAQPPAVPYRGLKLWEDDDHDSIPADMYADRESRLGNTGRNPKSRACLAEIEFITHRGAETELISGPNAGANFQALANGFREAIIHDVFLNQEEPDAPTLP